MMSKSLLSNNSYEWETPPEFFKPLEKEFGPFDLDPAATAQNAKAPTFYTKEQDGHNLHWFGRVWLNPPYGREIGDWVQRAYNAVFSEGCDIVVMVVPARVETGWFHDWIHGKAEVRYPRGRVKFIGPNGQKWNAPFPVAVVIYRKTD